MPTNWPLYKLILKKDNRKCISILKIGISFNNACLKKQEATVKKKKLEKKILPKNFFLPKKFFLTFEHEKTAVDGIITRF